MRTPSDVSQLFGVNQGIVKKWTYYFRDYLSREANPPKGTPRLFTQEDIMVLALVAEYWEETPDLENIYAMLNSGTQFEDKYIRIVYLNSSLLQDPAVDGELNKGIVLLGGMRPTVEQMNFHIAAAYKMAGDELVDVAIKSGAAFELAYPIFFMYRHALEVHLKILVPSKNDTHDFMRLINAFRSKYNTEFSSWAIDRLTEFHALDPFSDAFRYGDSNTQFPDTEKFVNLRQLRVVVDHLCTGLKNKALDANIPPSYNT